MAEAKIVLASHNKGKLKELREILRGHIDGLDVDTQVVDAASVNAPDVPETGVTFAENSLPDCYCRRLGPVRGRARRRSRHLLGPLGRPPRR